MYWYVRLYGDVSVIYLYVLIYADMYRLILLPRLSPMSVSPGMPPQKGGSPRLPGSGGLGAYGPRERPCERPTPPSP